MLGRSEIVGSAHGSDPVAIELSDKIMTGVMYLVAMRHASIALSKQSDGERAVQWLGARRAIPIVGADTRRGDRVAVEVGDSSVMLGVGEEVEGDLREELTNELLNETDLPGFAFIDADSPLKSPY